MEELYDIYYNFHNFGQIRSCRALYIEKITSIPLT